MILNILTVIFVFLAIPVVFVIFIFIGCVIIFAFKAVLDFYCSIFDVIKENMKF